MRKIDFKGRSYKNLNKDVIENMLSNDDWTTIQIMTLIHAGIIC